MKKIISVILAFMMIISLLSFVAISSVAQDDFVELNDFEYYFNSQGVKTNYVLGESLLNNSLGKGLWGLFGMIGTPICVSSDQKVANGNFSMKIASSQQSGWFSFNDAVKDNNIAGKKYIIFHIATPANSPGGNFEFTLTFTTASSIVVENKGNTGNPIYMTKSDSSNSWTTYEQAGNYSLPAGFSGWVRVETKHFKDSNGNLLSNIGTVNMFTSWMECAADTENNCVYLDSFFAVNDNDQFSGISSSSSTNSTSSTSSSSSTSSLSSSSSEVSSNVSSNDQYAPKVLNDFEGFNVGDELLRPESNQDGGVWAAYNANVRASNLNVGIGSGSMEIFNDTLRTGYGTKAAIKTGDCSITGKKYLVFHITAPPADVTLKNPLYKDQNSNERFFVFTIVPKTITGEGASAVGHWYKAKADNAGNKVQLKRDGQGSWYNANGTDFYFNVPFGWSGWVKLEIGNFYDSESGDALKNTDTLSLIELSLSQVGKEYGKVYFDSLLAVDDDDVIPNLNTGTNNNTQEQQNANTNDNFAVIFPIFILSLMILLIVAKRGMHFNN